MKVNCSSWLFLWLLGYTTVSAQTVSLEQVQTDTMLEIKHRILETDEWDVYHADRAFAYRSNPKQHKSLWTRIKDWLYDRFIRPLTSTTSGSVFRILIYLFGALGAGVLIFYLLQGRSNTSLSRRDVKWGEVFKNPTEIEDAQFKLWMADAERSGNFDEALKFLYLWSIRQMDKKDFIRYRPDYTNRSVIQKLKDASVRQLFSEVSLAFEYVFYGHFKTEESSYYKLKERAMNSSLNK